MRDITLAEPHWVLIRLRAWPYKNCASYVVVLDFWKLPMPSSFGRMKSYAPREGFGIYGSSLPSSFYRKDELLPAEMRYYDGRPPEIMKFGTASAGR